MSDFQIKVGGDFNELLRGFQQLEARAQQSGQVIGQRIDQGIQKFSTSSIAGLQAELNRLQQRQLTVGVNTAAFDALSKRIAEIGSQIDAANRKKVTVNTDPRSIAALRGQLGELQDELNRVAIGSQRFKELTAAIQATERELSKAGEASEDFRILDGVVQGIAFSLSNAVVDGAQRAIGALGGLVQEFGRLDTELRKAAAAGGEAGGYERLSRAVDQVGIEAAGTQMEVAQLATELVRGGMTIAQTEDSLAAIVRGAEATGTSFAQMGSVVSASLKGFGLQAKDAQRVVDALVQGANAAAADVSGMGNAFKYAAPVAKILGVSVEDLGLAVGLLTNAGIDASEAGVTLRNGLSKLASAAPQAGGAVQDLTGQSAMAAKAMRSLGVDIYNANGTLQPMEGVLLKLKGAFDKLDPSSKIRLAANLFGGEDDGAKWLALLNQSEEEIKRMATAMANTKGATDTARDAMQGFELKLAQLNGTLGSIGTTIGGVAAAALIPFIDAANVVVGVISGLPAPVKTLAAGLTLLAGAYVTAKVAAVAFAQAVKQPMVAAAIKEVTLLTRFVRLQFRRDLRAGTEAWRAFAAGFKTTSSNAAVAGLAQIAQGLRNLNAAQAVAGIQSLNQALKAMAVNAKAAMGAALANAAAQFKAGAASAAVSLRYVSRELGSASRNSAAAQAGLTGVTLLLQRGMTKGADGASKATLGLSKALQGLSVGGVTKGIATLGAKLAPAAAAMGTLAAVVAGLAPGILIYNGYMEETGKVTSSVGKTVDAYGKQLRDAGVAFEDFGRQGGPLQEIMTGIRRAFDDTAKSITEIPVVGGIAKAAFAALADTLKLLTGVKLYEWAKQTLGALKGLYSEFNKDLGIIESVDQFDQFQEQLRATSENADRFTARLKGLTSVPSSAIETWTGALNKNRQTLSDSVAALENYRGNLDSLISAAKSKKVATEDEKRIQQELISAYENQARAVGADIKITQAKLAQMDQQAERLGLVTSKLSEQQLTMAALSMQARELSASIAGIDAQVQIGGALLNLSQSLAALEQSRFAIARARGDYELQQAQDELSKRLEAAKRRGASELQLQRMEESGEKGLEAIRQQNRAMEAQAMQARYRALLAEQAIQQQLLNLSQQKAEQEARIGIITAQQDVAKASKTLADEQGKIFKDQKAIDAAVASVRAAKDLVEAQRQRLAVLQQIQPIEQQSAQATRETQINTLLAEGAAKGLQIAAEGSAGSMAGVSTSAVQATQQTQALATGVAGVTTQLGGASQAAGAVKDGLATAQTGIEGVGDSAVTSAGKFSGLTQAVADTAEAAQLGATVAKVFSQASGSIGGIAKAMASAANSARDFLGYLQQASGLPGSRWTGGPVDAGQSYRINDGPAGRSLGQESFLSAAGKLSLINRPANSLWTPPTSGVVIPAGVTETLKARGAFDSGRMVRAAVASRPSAPQQSGDGQLAATVARQAVAIGKLEQAVDRLTQKDWNVSVRVRGDGTGLQYLNQLNRAL